MQRRKVLYKVIHITPVLSASLLLRENPQQPFASALYYTDEEKGSKLLATLAAHPSPKIHGVNAILKETGYELQECAVDKHEAKKGKSIGHEHPLGAGRINITSFVVIMGA